jgi:hypothetical protein
MSWLADRAPGSTPFEQTLGLRPELLELYRAFYAELWSSGLVDPALLEVCRLRVAQLHRANGELGVRYEAAREAGLT